MNNYQPRSLLSSLLSAALTVLVIAIALRWAIRLLGQVWLPLVLLGGTVAGSTIGIAVWRSRSRGW